MPNISTLRIMHQKTAAPLKVHTVHNYNHFSGKTTFLMTNSPFEIVNAGMIYMLGQDWRRLFDIVIVNAKKPSFFSAKKRHFRVFSPRTGRLKWQRVVNLQRGKIYSGVSIK